MSDVLSPRICPICGEPVPKGRIVYCSAACKSKADRRKDYSRKGQKDRHPPFRLLTCPVCGKVSERPIKSKLCETCQCEKDKANSAAYRARAKAGTVRRLGESYPCLGCGELYTLTSGKQRYCPRCAAAETTKNIRAHKRAYNAKKREEDPSYFINLNKARPPKDTIRICPVCGNSFAASLHHRVYCSDDCRRKKIAENQKLQKMEQKTKQ